MFIKLRAMQHSSMFMGGINPEFAIQVLPCQAPFMIRALSELKEAACDH